MKTQSHFLISILSTVLIPMAVMGGSKQVSNPVPVFAGSEQGPEGLSTSDWQGIREAYEAGRHAVTKNADGTRTARNPDQQWKTDFNGRGFLVVPDDEQWIWGLRLTGIGRAGAQTAISGRAEVSHDGGRVVYRWNDSLEEWFVNDRRGLEQGWTIRERPGVDGTVMPDSEPLVLTLGVAGELVPMVSADGHSVAFKAPGGGTALNYGGLKAWDATGKPLETRFVANGEEGGCLGIEVSDAEATYPIHIDPVAQQAHLKASNTRAGDQFGFPVAISGDTVVVGARNEDSAATGVNGDQADNSARDSGAAYVFVRNGTTWDQQAYLKGSNTGSYDEFGFSVAISGDTIVVGADGEDSTATGIDGDQVDNSASNSGAAYVFVRNGTTWSQQAYLKASNTGTGDRFGIPLAISGDTMVVGARNEDSAATGVNGDQADNSASGAGAAYVFVRDDTTWSQQAYLKASNANAGDAFGFSVANSGETLVVGAWNEDSAATGVDGDQADNAVSDSGAAYVFTRDGTTWNQQAYLKASNTGAGDWFGIWAAVSGDTVVVGAFGEDSAATGVNGDQADNSASDSGAAYVFVRNGTTWDQQAYLKGSNTDAGDNFGISATVSGDTAVVGAWQEDSAATGVNGDQADNSASRAGAAYVYVRQGATWSQQAYLKASNSGAYHLFGCSVAIMGDTVVVGEYLDDSAYVFVPEDTPIRITDTSMEGMLMTIHFEGEPGCTEWKLMGSGDLQSFPDDRTPGCTITETAPGQYELEIDCTALPHPYFFRIER